METENITHKILIRNSQLMMYTQREIYNSQDEKGGAESDNWYNQLEVSIYNQNSISI